MINNITKEAAYLSELVYHKSNYNLDNTQILVRDCQVSRTRYIVFRGTDEKSDWRINLKRIRVTVANGYAEIHRGFLNEVNRISSTLNKIIDNTTDGYSICFTGHSLGGALAQVAAVVMKKRCICITFGAPKVGDAIFCAQLESNTYLAIYENLLDVVPKFPILGYAKPKFAIHSFCRLGGHEMAVYKKYVMREDND